MTVSSNPDVTRASVPGLREQVAGNVLEPTDGGYDAARTVWNGMIDRHPAIIVQASSTPDVVTAVQFAAEHNLPIAIRGGGHSAAGLGISEGGLTIDLSGMRGVTVDSEARTAQVEGGATWADLDGASQAHGLATTGGAISTTGVGGLTLGGGLGNLMRSYGLACDNLRSVEVVTASGGVVTASANENADLFWGLRGGGGNFGVVTEFVFDLHPVNEVLGGMLLFPIDQAPALFRLYREVTSQAPDALSTFAVLLHTPDGVPVCGLIICYNGPVDEGEQAIRRFREFGEPLVNGVGPIPYGALQSMLDEGFPSGLPVYWRSHFLTGIPNQALDTITDQFSRVTSPLSAVLIEHLGGAVSRVPRDETAFDHRDAEYNLAVIGRWADPSEAPAHIAWTRSLTDAMQPHARGVYVNYLGVDERGDRVRAAYGDKKYKRLVELKRKYDPNNRFRFNQNVSPTNG